MTWLAQTFEFAVVLMSLVIMSIVDNEEVHAVWIKHIRMGVLIGCRGSADAKKGMTNA